jgi:hypothetical protein
MGQILHGSAKTTPGVKGGIKTSKRSAARAVGSRLKDGQELVPPCRG